LEIVSAATGKRPVRRYLLVSLLLVLLHGFFMIYRSGSLPIAPAIPDEVIINDASISLARGHGYVASSFTDSKYGLDHMFAHFPPLYPYTEALAFKVLGVSAYSLRFTTILMSIAGTVVLSLLMLRLCVAGLLNWDVALLIQALYCTNTSLVALERMARMESMISVLMLLSLWCIVRASTRPDGEQGWLPMLGAGLFGALCMAVHPEALTALVLLGPLMLFVVPVKPVVKLVSVGLFFLVPLAVGLSIYGAQLAGAVKQFLAIARDSMDTNPTSAQWLQEALHNRDLSRVNRNLFLIGIMLLLAAAPVVYVAVTRRLPSSSLRYRMGLWLGVAGVVEFLVMVLLLRMDDRRCQFLFGTLLVCTAVCLFGAAPLRRWQYGLGWLLVVVQCGVVGYYLSARQNRVADMNPDRYMGLLHALPAGASLAATPGLWLDLQEERRPFTLILYGLDGETEWQKTGNPLDRFDIILIEKYYSKDRPWWADEAKEGRKKYLVTIGSDVISVYVRDNIVLQNNGRF